MNKNPILGLLYAGLQTTNPAKMGACSLLGQASLSGDGLCSLRIRPEMDQAKVAGVGAPTVVSWGVYSGFSLPTAGADEVLFFNDTVARRWDGASDIIFGIQVCLAAANVGASTDFAFTTSWEHYVKGVVVPATSNPVTCDDVATGADVAQYLSFADITFIIDYDIDGEGNEVVAGETLGIKLDRVVPESTNDFAGEIIVLDTYIQYQCDKFLYKVCYL